MTWTNITNGQLAVGAPLRSVDILALRDNIIAQANGDAGAPKQQTNGIEDGAVTAPKINFVANGLQNSGGSLAISCPAFNTVGSYIFGLIRVLPQFSISAGTNYSAGGNNLQVQSTIYIANGSEWAGGNADVSGTWKLMGGGGTNISGNNIDPLSVFCRVS